MLLENLTLFLRIVEKGGLAVAGRELGLAPATVTERLAALETYYGARLLTRTTRSISLTEEGRELAVGARRILAEAEETEARIRLGMDQISGVIRLTSTIDLGRNRIVPLLDAFMEQHPAVVVDLFLSDDWVDLVGKGLDFGVRLGVLSDNSLNAHRLNRNQNVICASPEYLAEHGTPLHPDQLSEHNCIVIRFGNNMLQSWDFVVNDKLQTTVVRGNRIANNGEQVRMWGLDGRGIIRKSEWDVERDIEAGRLVPILKEYMPSPTTLQLVFPKGHTQPRRVRMLMDYLALGLGGSISNQASVTPPNR